MWAAVSSLALGAALSLALRVGAQTLLVQHHELPKGFPHTFPPGSIPWQTFAAGYGLHGNEEKNSFIWRETQQVVCTA